MRRCRECGCVDDAACVRLGLLDVECCYWVQEDLCSACEDELEGDGELFGWEHPPRAVTGQYAGLS